MSLAGYGPLADLDRYDLLVVIGLIILGIGVWLEFGLYGLMMYAGASLFGIGLIGAMNGGSR